MENRPIAVGQVTSLAINGSQVWETTFNLNGPEGDNHAGFSRHLSGHDGMYLRTSDLNKGSIVFNWRSWTGLSKEEIESIETEIGCIIPVGCLLENVTLSGIPDFSQLETGSRLVFPAYGEVGNRQQAILTVWEENGPCQTVATRLEKQHGTTELKARFLRAAVGKRGVMGFVLSAGLVQVGDKVLVYSPNSR